MRDNRKHRTISDEPGRAQSTRENLVSSAIRVIARDGYVAATTQAVLDESGLSRGSLLFQFPTRLDLMTAAARESIRRSLTRIDAAMSAHGDDALAALETYPDILWTIQNEEAAIAYTEIQLASRWDRDLFDNLKDIIEKVDKVIAARLLELAEGCGLPGLDQLASEVHILINFTQGLAINARLAPDPGKVANALAVAKRHFLSQLHSRV